MKLIWEEGDIVAGRIVSSRKGDGPAEIIGYRMKSGTSVYGFVDLRDGMFIELESKERMAKLMTAAEYIYINDGAQASSYIPKEKK